MAIAFLKGQREAASGERKGRLYMRPPEDPLVTKSGCFREAELFEIVGNVYGLANAPYLFSHTHESSANNTTRMARAVWK